MHPFRPSGNRLRARLPIAASSARCASWGRARSGVHDLRLVKPFYGPDTYLLLHVVLKNQEEFTPAHGRRCEWADDARAGVVDPVVATDPAGAAARAREERALVLARPRRFRGTGRQLQSFSNRSTLRAFHFVDSGSTPKPSVLTPRLISDTSAKRALHFELPQELPRRRSTPQ